MALKEERGALQPSVPRGALTGLLQEIVEAPEAPLGEAWEQGLRAGAVFGRFQLLREIGRGGFGVVWEARDRELGRTVAFKAVRAGARAALREERLLREAEAAARLSHPNIVTLHDVGKSELGPYLVFELLRGETLADRLEQGPLPLREAIRIAVEVARGLAHAHGQGVVHRDLKPANVFLCEDGNVKVLDFGLAHAFGQRRTDGGTPSYMAPEQWRGAPEDERSDVFALGVILFRMLSGKLPFPDADEGRAVQSSRPAPDLDVAEVPALGGLVGRMLEKDPVRRPRDGGEVLSALSAFQRELDRTPSAQGIPVRTRSRLPRRLAALTAAGLVLGAGLAAAVLWLRRGAEPEPRERVTVAVVDFANQTGDPELDGLSGMLITSLEQSRRLQVLTRVRMLDVLRQLGKQNVATVDEALGREMALSAGVRALVLATIRRFDQLYAIEMKVLDPVKSEYLFTLKEEGKGKASVPGMIDRLSERTREQLRCDSPADIQASSLKVAEATTASFEAWQHYFKGDQLKEAIRYDPAIAEYRRAIAIDPEFALPHYRIAYLGEFTGMEVAERKAEIEAAMKSVDRLPMKERLFIQAWKAVLDGRKDEAHRIYARMVEAYPQDKEALFMAGDLYLHSERHAEGLPFFERAAALDPVWEPAQMHVMDSLAALGRNEELAVRARAWVERAPSATAYRAMAMAMGAGGRLDEAVAAARRALDIDGTTISRAYLSAALLIAERYQEAEALVRPHAAAGRPVPERLLAAKDLATALAYQGRRREALAVVDGLPAGVRFEGMGREELRLSLVMCDGKAEEVLPAARALARTDKKGWTAYPLAIFGDVEAAAEPAQRLPEGPIRRAYEAVLAWQRGEKEQALSALRDLARGAMHDTRGLAAWLLARFAAESGRDAEVVEAVEIMRTAPGDVWRGGAWPAALFSKARAQERLGQTEAARETLDHLLAIWKRADPDLPHLAEAKAMRRRLLALR